MPTTGARCARVSCHAVPPSTKSTMAIVRLQAAFGRIFRQRCFYLFLSLVLLIAIAPHVLGTLHGRLVMQVVLFLVMISILAMVGRTTLPFVLGLVLGIPAMVFQLVALLALFEPVRDHALSMGFYVAFYVVVVTYLLGYVFSPDVM